MPAELFLPAHLWLIQGTVGWVLQVEEKKRPVIPLVCVEGDSTGILISPTAGSRDTNQSEMVCSEVASRRKFYSENVPIKEEMRLIYG